MADLVVRGAIAEVILMLGEDDDVVYAECLEHNDYRPHCGWKAEYDTLHDAYEYSSSHADWGS